MDLWVKWVFYSISQVNELQAKSGPNKIFLDNLDISKVRIFFQQKCSVENNLSCILTLPSYQNKGYGRFLIDFSKFHPFLVNFGFQFSYINFFICLVFLGLSWCWKLYIGLYSNFRFSFVSTRRNNRNTRTTTLWYG